MFGVQESVRFVSLYPGKVLTDATFRHLIADHIGWFKETEGTDGGRLRTVEDLVRAKGGRVVRGRLDAGGVVEYTE